MRFVKYCRAFTNFNLRLGLLKRLKAAAVCPRRVVAVLLAVALAGTSLFVVPLSGGAAGPDGALDSGGGLFSEDVNAYAASTLAASDAISFGVGRVDTGSGSTASAYFVLTNVNVQVLTSATKADQIRSITISYPSTLSIDTAAAAAVPEAVFSRWQLQSTVLDAAAGNKVSNYLMPTPINSTQATLALSNLRFVSSVSGADTGAIEVAFSADTLISWMETRPNGDRLRHFYQRVDTAAAMTWSAAYNAALTKTFCGLNGYLCTMMYEEEGRAIVAFTGTSGWLAATRYRRADTSRAKIGKDPNSGVNRVSAPINASDYFTGGVTAGVENGQPGNNWYWCAGPSWENGRQFYSVGAFSGATGAEDPAHYHDESGNPMWNNWSRNAEPNGVVSPYEGCMQTGISGTTKWNDLYGLNTNTVVMSYYVEYSEGWANEGGGTYIPPSSTFRAALPIPDPPAPEPDPIPPTPVIGTKYKVSFSPNWGKLKIRKSYKRKWTGNFKPIPKAKTVRYGKTYGKLPAMEKNKNPKGYRFAGWYTAASKGTRITKKSKVAIANAATLYAHWKARKYKVTFKAGGKSKTVKFAYGKKYGKLPSVKDKTGRFKFLGWYTKKTGGKKITPKSIVKITKARTYYAHWRRR